ncbi:MAG: hypothetical protein AAFQ83_05995 [Bacteroidota bacterium]
MKQVSLLCCTLGCFLLPSLLMGQPYFGAINSTSYDRWALGLNLGTLWVQGDIQPQVPGYQVGVYAQKSIQRPFDIRFSFNWGQASGQDLSPTDGLRFNPIFNSPTDTTSQFDSTMAIFQNYQMTAMDVALEFKLNLNRVFLTNSGDNWDAYVLAGMGILLSLTRMDIYDDQAGVIYDYSTVPTDDLQKARESLKLLVDGNYETLAERDFINSTFVGKYVFNTQFVMGLGGRYRLANDLAIGMEARYTFVGSDLLDGQQWKDAFSTDPNSVRQLSNDGIVRIALTLDYTLQ